MALPTGRGSLHRGRSVETGGAQRGPRAVAPAWVAGIEGERVSRGADVGPENTDCQRFGGPAPRSRSLRGLAARNRNCSSWRGPGQIRPRPDPLGLDRWLYAPPIPPKSRQVAAARRQTVPFPPCPNHASAPPTQEPSAHAPRPKHQRTTSLTERELAHREAAVHAQHVAGDEAAAV